MNISWLIANRILFNKQNSFSKFIIRLSIVATSLSVLAMIATLSFVNGFQEEISNKIFSFWGHLHVQHFSASKSLVTEEMPILENDTILQTIHKQKGLLNAYTYATKSAVIEKNNAIEGILIKGIGNQNDFSRFKSFLKVGQNINFSDSNYSKGILVPEPIANSLKLKVKDTVRMHFISTKQGENSTYRKLVVAGIYKTGIEEYDKLFVISDIRLLQHLNNWQPNQIGGYEIYIDDYTKIDDFNNKLVDQLPTEWVSKTTKESYPNIFDWLNIQDVNRNVVFIIMGIVAVINLITSLLVLVLERTRMVGILKAIGTPNWQIQQIFLFHACVITIIGVGIGLISGLSLCWLQQVTHFIHLDESSYYISYAPIQIVGWQVALLCVGTALVCFLALIIPTLTVKKLSPIKAIQFR